MTAFDLGRRCPVCETTWQKVSADGATCRQCKDFTPEQVQAAQARQEARRAAEPAQNGRGPAPGQNHHRHFPSDDDDDDFRDGGPGPVPMAPKPAVAPKIVTLAKLRETYSGEVKWLVEGYIAQGELTEIAAPPESLKSWAMADLTRAVMTGGSWLGHLPVPQGSAIYVEQERINNLVYQMNLLDQAYGCDLGKLLVLPPGTFVLNDQDSQALLTTAVARLKPILVVINSFRSVFRGRAADGIEVARALGWLGHLAEQHGVAVVLVDQTNKAGGTGLVRGMAAHADSLQKEFEADAVLHLERDRDEVGRGIGPARLYTGKRRAGESGEPFSFEVQDMHNGVAPTWLENIPLERPTASREPAATRVMRALKETKEPVNAETIASHTGLGVGTVQNQLTALKRSNLAEQAHHGYWQPKSSSSLGPSDSDDDDFADRKEEIE